MSAYRTANREAAKRARDKRANELDSMQEEVRWYAASHCCLGELVQDCNS